LKFTFVLPFVHPTTPQAAFTHATCQGELWSFLIPLFPYIYPITFTSLLHHRYPACQERLGGFYSEWLVHMFCQVYWKICADR